MALPIEDQSELVSKVLRRGLILHPSPTLYEDIAKSKKHHLSEDDIIQLILDDNPYVVQSMQGNKVNINVPIKGLPPIVFCFSSDRISTSVLLSFLTCQVNTNFSMGYLGLECNFLDFAVNVCTDINIIDMLLASGAAPKDKLVIPYRLPISNVFYTTAIIKYVYSMDSLHLPTKRKIIADLIEFEYADYSSHFTASVINIEELDTKTLLMLLVGQMNCLNSNFVNNICVKLDGAIINRMTLPNKNDPVGLLTALIELNTRNIKIDLNSRDVMEWLMKFQPNNEVTSQLRIAKIELKSSKDKLTCTDAWAIILLRHYDAKVVKKLFKIRPCLVEAYGKYKSVVFQ